MRIFSLSLILRHHDHGVILLVHTRGDLLQLAFEVSFLIGLDKFGGIYPPREGDLVVIEDREVENLVHEIGDRYFFREIIVIQDYSDTSFCLPIVHQIGSHQPIVGIHHRQVQFFLYGLHKTIAIRNHTREKKDLRAHGLNRGSPYDKGL